ncbi:MAG: hypothetical protein GC193_10505 [Cryomorphaceae bacterium]|nr:hypothetical protein [Cryomorphaceae bacterium]
MPYQTYEITNHPARSGQVLGNVTATVSDAKTTTFNGEVGYTPRINTLTDYYPFGMMMSGRSFEETGYGYGFQGQEKDDEIKGEGNSIYYKYRMHDARIGRFFAVDPLAASFPWNSTYAFSENRVVDAVELEGLESKIIHAVWQRDDFWGMNFKVEERVKQWEELYPGEAHGPLGDGTLLCTIDIDRKGNILQAVKEYTPSFAEWWQELVEDEKEWERKNGADVDDGLGIASPEDDNGMGKYRAPLEDWDGPWVKDFEDFKHNDTIHHDYPYRESEMKTILIVDTTEEGPWRIPPWEENHDPDDHPEVSSQSIPQKK